jgi:hypothetical protein
MGVREGRGGGRDPVAFRLQDHDIKVQPRPLNIEALSVKLGWFFGALVS